MNFYQLTMYEEAVKSFEDCLKIENKYPSAHYVAAECLMQLNQYDKAINYLLQSLKLFPEHADSL